MATLSSIPAIVDQHAEDAAFLWIRRRNEIDGPLLGETDIGRIDQRLDANLEGLMASGRRAWDTAKARFSDYPEAGELFVLGYLALRSGSPKAVADVIELALPLGAAAVSGFSGAIARAPKDELRPYVADWVRSRDDGVRSLGLAALCHHRVDPGPQLESALADPAPDVRRRALRLAAQLKRREVLPAVHALLRSRLPQERLTAAFAACLLGDVQSAHATLDRLATTDADFAAAAIELRLLSTPAAAAKRWLQARLEQPLTHAAATACVGLLGDRNVMPWLIEKMREPNLAAAAANSLRDLFEVDFGDTDVFTTEPESLGPAFAVREEPVLPNADRVAAWWDEGKGGKGHDVFRSMRWHRLEAVRKALAEPDLLPANWRKTRAFPAWM
jgi:uncharacterized protein (TIGR02270 family)